jgi:predicted CoA-binding protein
MKTIKAAIEPFLKPCKIALAGVSRDQKKFGYEIFKLLREAGYEVYPVNPNAEKIGETTCYPNLQTVPADVRHLAVLTPKKQTASVIGEALTRGFDHIWIQQMSDTPEALQMLSGKKINIVTGECLFMHVQPVKGVHKFHRSIRSFFGRMPK